MDKESYTRVAPGKPEMPVVKSGRKSETRQHAPDATKHLESQVTRHPLARGEKRHCE